MNNNSGFTLNFDFYSAGRMKSDGKTYICNQCQIAAEKKYQNP